MSTSSNTHRRYTFGRFTLDIDRGALIADGKDVKLRPKSFQVLQVLVERHGCLVSKEDLLNEIWGKTIVTDDAVTQCLIDIRRALGDRSQQIIQTVPRRGYIFDIPATLIEAETGISETPSPISSPSRKANNWRTGVAILLVLAAGVVFWALSERGLDRRAEPDGTHQSSPYSIAVLPFLDLSSDQDITYFAEGVSEEILNLLAQVKDLRVIARTSSFSFDRQTSDIATIKEKLNVTHVLEGSVRQFEDTIRITVQLIDAANSEHIWSETYNRDLGHVFAIQDEIAFEVLTRLAATLNISIPQARQTNAEAHRLYLQAVHMVDQLDFSKNSEAEAIMRRALALDPTFAPAWRELSRILWRQIGDDPDYERDIARTLEALERALELDPNDAATLAYMAWHTTDFDGDFIRGARLFERALSYEPANENVIRTAGIFARALARPEDAIRLGEFGISRNPLCYACYSQLAAAYRFGDRMADAEITLRKTQTLFNDGYGWLGMVLLGNGEPERALDMFSKELSEGFRLFGEVLALHSLGRAEESAVALTHYFGLVGDRDSWGLAQIFAWTGQYDAAFEALDDAASAAQLLVDGRIVRRNLIGISLMTREPIFQSLHDDPRWEEHLQKYGISAAIINEMKFSLDIPD